MTTFEEILLIYAHSLRNAQDILDLDLQMNIYQAQGPRTKTIRYFPSHSLHPYKEETL